MELRCMCGDTACPSCGTAQGTLIRLPGWKGRLRNLVIFATAYAEDVKYSAGNGDWGELLENARGLQDVANKLVAEAETRLRGDLPNGGRR